MRTLFWVCIWLMLVYPLKGQQSVISVPISLDAEPTELKLSRVMDVEKIVRLQTTPANLLPQNFRIIPMDDYIIVVDNPFMAGRGSIQQYSADGKFMRVLARTGGGPGEFIAIQAWATDPVNKRLYYSHRGDPGHIEVIDLQRGRRLERIAIPYDKLTETSKTPGIKNIVLVDNNTLACVPMEMTDMKYPVFFMNLSGEFIKGITYTNRNDEPADYSLRRVSDGVHLTVNQAKSYSNMTYKMGAGLTPYFTLDVVEAIEEKTIISPVTGEPQRSVEGITITWEAEGPTSMIFQHVRIGWTEINEKMGLKILKPHFFMDKENEIAFPISRMIVDYLGEFAYEGQPLVHNNGALGAVKLDVPDLLEYATSGLQDSTLAPDVRSRLVQLNSELKEGDNPVLLIGKLR